jgi:hypothetical protein
MALVFLIQYLYLVCAPKEFIDEKLKSGYLAILVTDRLIN